MARVTVEMPRILEDGGERFSSLVSETAVVALDDELGVIVGEIRESAAMPVDRGFLRRAMTATPAVASGRQVLAAIVSIGVASAYAAVMDLGRRAGQRMPPVENIRAWFHRKEPGKIDQRARELRDKRHASGMPRKKFRIADLRKEAEDEIAFLIARAIARNGIAGRQFAEAKRDDIGRRCAIRVEYEIGVAMRREGLA